MGGEGGKLTCLRCLKDGVRRLQGGGGDDRGDFTPPPCPHLHQGLNWPLDNCKAGRFEAMGCQADILAPRVGRWGIGKVLSNIKPQLQLFTQEYQIESTIIDQSAICLRLKVLNHRKEVSLEGIREGWG